MKSTYDEFYLKLLYLVEMFKVITQVAAGQHCTLSTQYTHLLQLKSIECYFLFISRGFLVAEALCVTVCGTNGHSSSQLLLYG